MSESRTRKPVFQNYYTDEDYDDIMVKLPDIIKEAERRAIEELEPTIHERKEVMDIIKNFIRNKKRKVYGGTAINEELKAVNPEDAIYDEYTFSDIEFYSPLPVPDLIELTNLLYEKKYKFVSAREAQHEGTYSIIVNFVLYCDISYVPARIYNGIKTIEIDGINYVDPHFILIDQLRIINQPLTTAAFRWEKTFKRMYKLLKNYPLEYYDKPLKITKPVDEIHTYIHKIKNQFMEIKEVQNTCLIAGFEAYNFFIRHAIGDRSIEQMARTIVSENKLETFIANVPYQELISVNYYDTVERLFRFIKEIVIDPKEVTLDEYFPLFQFTGYSVFINYKGFPLVRVYEADGYCVPNIKTTKGYMYVSFQYLLMFMFINKFRAHLDKNREMYFNYGIAISNLVTARNVYLTKQNISVINNTVFGEFRISCIGSTISCIRESQLRGLEKYKQGKLPFRYTPEHFFNQTPEQQAKFDPTKFKFKNTSGNKIINPKNLLFKLDEDGNIKENYSTEEAYSDETTDQGSNANIRSPTTNSNNSTTTTEELNDTTSAFDNEYNY